MTIRRAAWCTPPARCSRSTSSMPTPSAPGLRHAGRPLGEPLAQRPERAAGLGSVLAGLGQWRQVAGPGTRQQRCLRDPARSRRSSGPCACARRQDAADRSQIGSMVEFVPRKRLSPEAGLRRRRHLLHGRLRTIDATDCKNPADPPARASCRSRLSALASPAAAAAQRPRRIRWSRRRPPPATRARRRRARTCRPSSSMSGTTCRRSNRCGTVPWQRAARYRASCATTTSTWPTRPPTGVVDLGNPGASMMVTKVGGGHNCWLAADSACADQLTVWIRNWAGADARRLARREPAAAAAARRRRKQVVPGEFRRCSPSTVYPLLTQYCSRCHSSGASTPQSPFFAEADVDVAYAAVRAKINLDTPADSRLVVRLRDEFHNCWTDCAQSADDHAGRDAGLRRPACRSRRSIRTS